jgi:Tfp pilus assembly PilM family ATPase
MFGLNLFGSNKSIVGLDIGSNSIKAVELQRSRGEVMVSHLGMEHLCRARLQSQTGRNLG